MTLELDKHYGPVEQLALPPSTTLADALHAYRDFRKPLSIRPSFYAARQGDGAPWVQPFLSRERELRELIADQARDAANEARVSISTNAFMRELEEVLPTMEERRQIGHTVARRLKAVAHLGSKLQQRDLTEMPEQLFLCRCDGHGGTDDGGDRRFSWAYKCGSTRFCPDCAREHSRYEAERYGPALLEHVARGPEYRAYQGVFTRPAVPVGRMAQGVDETLELFRRWLELERPCWFNGEGWSTRKKWVKVWQPDNVFRLDADGTKHYDGDGIHGALVQLECHLTAKGAWHPHLNVILLTKGPFDYERVRRTWGYNVQLEQIEPRPGEELEAGFARAFAELIKYPFVMVGEKNAEKRAAGATNAPAFEEWPDQAIVEWHGATRRERETESANGVLIQGARWLRSYGVLHGIPPPPITEQEVRWLTRLTFTDDGRYVGSTPGSKFQGSHRKSNSSGYRVPSIRPPPRSARPPPGG